MVFCACAEEPDAKNSEDAAAGELDGKFFGAGYGRPNFGSFGGSQGSRPSYGPTGGYGAGFGDGVGGTYYRPTFSRPGYGLYGRDGVEAAEEAAKEPTEPQVQPAA